MKDLRRKEYSVFIYGQSLPNFLLKYLAHWKIVKKILPYRSQMICHFFYHVRGLKDRHLGNHTPNLFFLFRSYYSHFVLGFAEKIGGFLLLSWRFSPGMNSKVLTNLWEGKRREGYQFGTFLNNYRLVICHCSTLQQDYSSLFCFFLK